MAKARTRPHPAPVPCREPHRAGSSSADGLPHRPGTGTEDAICTSYPGGRGVAGGFASGLVRGIDANRTIKEELAAAVRVQSARRRISVTDLVNPRQAFFRWTRPDIQPSPDRVQAMMSGTGFHALLGQAISTEEYVEQFVEWEGIVGRIDIYEDVPVEVKTTGALPADPVQVRPGYIDQLGMYCAITRVASGRLLVYRRNQFGRAPELRAYRVGFRDLDAVGAEMVRRRALFQEALEAHEAASLPCCEWHGRGCDYEQICGCAAAPPHARIVPASACSVERDAALEEMLGARLAVARHGAHEGLRLNDLVFPRKAAYQRRHADGAEDEDPDDAAVEARLRDLEREGFRGTLYKALRFGIPGAFRKVPVRVRTLADRVGTFRGVPTLLRSTRLRQMVERERLPYVSSHYFDRMAFEAALVGTDRARLILYYETLPGDKFVVYDVVFRDPRAAYEELDRRLALLESGAPPGELPACPGWMARRCAYAPGCGCGDAAT